MEKTPTLIVTTPDSDPLTFELRGERVGLGREVDNQIQIDVKEVSSCHCEFRKGDAGYELVDLGSTNGTRVNGKIVQTRELADGDRILLGETVAAHFVILAEGESATPAAVAGGEEESKAAAAYTKMDDKLQSIAANIAAKEAVLIDPVIELAERDKLTVDQLGFNLKYCSEWPKVRSFIFISASNQPKHVLD